MRQGGFGGCSLQSNEGDSAMEDAYGVDERLYLVLDRVRNAIHREADALLRENGLTSAQLAVLRALQSDGSMSVVDIVKRIGSTAGNVPVVIGNLEKMNLVTRRKSEQDRRVTVVSISRKGSSVLDEVYPAWNARLGELLGVLDLDSKLELANSLDALADSICGAAGDDRSHRFDVAADGISASRTSASKASVSESRKEKSSKDKGSASKRNSDEQHEDKDKDLEAEFNITSKAQRYASERENVDDSIGSSGGASHGDEIREGMRESTTDANSTTENRGGADSSWPEPANRSHKPASKPHGFGKAKGWDSGGGVWGSFSNMDDSR